MEQSSREGFSSKALPTPLGQPATGGGSPATGERAGSLPSSAFAGSGAALTVPAGVPSGSGSTAPASSEQQQQQPALRHLRSASSGARRLSEVWGWLRPAPDCKRTLPSVLLQGRGVAVGRGRDAFHERLPQLVLSRTSSLLSANSSTLGPGAAEQASAANANAKDSPGGSSASGSSGGGSPAADSMFVEVADGRVSRVHLYIKWDVRQQAAVLEVRRTGWWLLL